MSKSTIVFTPSGKRGEFDHGTKVLDAARALGVDIDSLCGGNGLCGRCKVAPGDGEFAKHGLTSARTHVSAEGPSEARYRQKRRMATHLRLSCQATLEGDLVVDVPPESQVHRQVIRKAADERPVPPLPAVQLVTVTVEEPDMHKPSGDLERLKAALAPALGVDERRLDLDFHVLKHLQAILRKGRWRVTAAVHERKQIIALWPGVQSESYGLAVDLGSTTIAAHLCDLQSGKVLASAGLMNPQIKYGEDVMSRVSYAMMNAGGAEAMTTAVHEALNELAVTCCADAGVDPSLLLEFVVVGNPIMHHLFLGIDPVELGGAPFALAAQQAQTIRATHIGPLVNEGARIYVLPCIAGHVGADMAAVVLAEAPDEEARMTFIADVGTNAEMVLGHRGRLLAASSPTGPAFEGAQISAGQRAAPGAIERVRIDLVTLTPTFRVIGSDKWSDEPGFWEEIETTKVTGICGSGIIEAIAEMYLAQVVNQDGHVDGSKAATFPAIHADGRTFAYQIYDGARGGVAVSVTQNDVRAIQMAKAALYAGYRLLADYHQTDTVERVALAGAFGTHIDVKHAMTLGLIPDAPLAQVASVGNAAGAGARMALLNRDLRRRIETLVGKIEKIETAVEAKFQDHFIEAMALPHKTAPFKNLAAEVPLPQPFEIASAAEGDDGGRRRRRRG